MRAHNIERKRLQKTSPGVRAGLLFHNLFHPSGILAISHQCQSRKLFSKIVHSTSGCVIMELDPKNAKPDMTPIFEAISNYRPEEILHCDSGKLPERSLRLSVEYGGLDFFGINECYTPSFIRPLRSFDSYFESIERGLLICVVRGICGEDDDILFTRIFLLSLSGSGETAWINCMDSSNLESPGDRSTQLLRSFLDSFDQATSGQSDLSRGQKDTLKNLLG